MAEEGVWRTIAGHRVFIKKDGTIVSKNKMLDGKKLSKKGKKEVKNKKLTKKEMQEKYKIEEWEQKMLDDYTSVNYTSINGQLRKNFGEIDKCSLDVQNACEGIDNILNKLPKYEGVVHRKEDFDRGSYYIEGRVYTNHGYTSTTAWNDISGGTVLEIKQSSGCNISTLSRSPGENEVLIPRGFTYKITKVEKTDSGYTKVYAEEVKKNA